jgi:Putative zinc-finger
MHPDFSLLIRFMDGEISGRQLRKLQAHLAACPDCRAEAASLRLEAAPELPAVPPVSDLLAGMRQWWNRQTGDPIASRQRIQRVAREIAPFLGTGGAEQILARVTPEGGNLIPNVEPVLAAFLGRRAAQGVIDNVMAIVVRA